MKSAGIYCMYFDKDPSSRYYIGQSVNLSSRMCSHVQQLKSNSHHNFLMQEYYNTTKETPEVYILEHTDNLDEREQFWIKEFNSFYQGFNLTEGGQGEGSSSGYNSPHSLYDKATYKEILIQLTTSKSYAEISSVLKVSYDVVRSISLGHCHGWLQAALPDEYQLVAKLRIGRIRTEVPRDILSSILAQIATSDSTLVSIAKAHGVSLGVVKNLVNGTCYKYMNTDTNYTLALAKQVNRRSVSARPTKYPDIKDPTNRVHSVVNAREFSKSHGLDQSALIKVLNYKQKSHKGWTLAT